jgi:signal transduction histidine kinase
MSVGSALPPRKGEHVSRPEGPRTERRTDELSGALSIAAHDVTEAVRVVTGYLELFDAQAGQALDDSSQRYLGGVRDGLDHVDRLMTGVLAYVRACTDEHQLEVIELDLSLEDALRPLRAGLEERQARLLTEGLPTVRADAGRTRDLLRALASNAVTFAGDEPLVLQVGAERNGDGWEISVADNGIGMPADAVDRVFSPFERAHPRSVATGPGLGLAIARCIVERRGGRIWIETGESGTTVRFTLPDRTDA